MLHIVNGDHLATRIREAGILRPFDPALKDTRDPDTIVPWRDVLYEGPVRGGQSPVNLANDRARYIASRGWAPYIEVRQAFGARDAALASSVRHDEVVFWFEDDLYDGLQLAQALDRLAIRRPESTVFSWVLLSSRSSQPVDAEAEFAARQPVPPAAFADARAFWTAFISAEPADLVACVCDVGLETSLIQETARRLLAEYPSTEGGLARSERQVLATLEAGTATPLEIVRSAIDADPRPYLADLQVQERLHRFASPDEPLIRRVDGGTWVSPVVDLLSPDEPDLVAFAAQVLELTPTGRAVLTGERDLLDLGVPPRWVGGVEIAGQASWRWDEGIGRLVGPAEIS